MDRIAAHQAKGGSALMVGDGINDSAALSAAPVSASFAGATDIAQTASDIVLMQPRLLPKKRRRPLNPLRLRAHLRLPLKLKHRRSKPSKQQNQLHLLHRKNR